MVFNVSGMYGVEILRLITGLRYEDGLARPVNGEVGNLEPGEFEDNIFSTTRHDVKEMFLCYSFYVGEEDTSEADFTVFVC